MHQSISIIVPSAQTRVSDGVTHSSNLRSFNQVDRFAAEVAKASGVQVAIIEGTLANAPADGFLFTYAGWELDAFVDLGPRIVLLEAERGAVWNGLVEKLVTDRCRLAAAIEDARYSDWTHGKDFSGGVHGLMSVAERGGMKVDQHRSPNSDYGFLRCPGHCHGLVELLIHYLNVYQEMGLHLRNYADSAMGLHFPKAGPR